MFTWLISANNPMMNYAFFVSMMTMMDPVSVIPDDLDRIDQLVVIRNRPSFLVGFSVPGDLMVLMNGHKPSCLIILFLLLPMMINSSPISKARLRLGRTLSTPSTHIHVNSLNTNAASLQRLSFERKKNKTLVKIIRISFLGFGVFN